ncbi:MAG TPA: imelysin family protein [Tianweitania sediminis]|jgi:hypothetical protein|nr:imelysin family protein [Tianweitania sediminis]
MRKFLLLLIPALLSCPAVAQEGPGAQISLAFARPAFDALVEAADHAETTIGSLCEAPSQPALDAARDAFGGLVTTWGRASVLRFGPLAANNRFERLFFWPDPRGTTLKQVQGLLVEENEAATTAASLADGSVARQGLPALEVVLFGAGAEELTATGGGFRCRLGHAIAATIEDVAQEVLADWAPNQPFAQSFIAPDGSSAPYHSASEVKGEIIKALTTVFEFVHAAELRPALGEKPDKARGKRAPFWRSDLTFELVVAQLQGARDLLEQAGFTEALPKVHRWIPDSILFELNTALGALRSVDIPPEHAFEDQNARGKINLADLAVEHAGQQVSEQLAGALGLSMGFNALDGD